MVVEWLQACPAPARPQGKPWQDCQNPGRPKFCRILFTVPRQRRHIGLARKRTRLQGQSSNQNSDDPKFTKRQPASVPGMPLAKSPDICMESTSLETRRKQKRAQQCPWQAGVRRKLLHEAGHSSLMSGPAACWGCLGAPPRSSHIPQAWPQGL